MGETPDLQETIRENIEHIKSVLRDCSTESVVGYITVKHMRGFPQEGLSSPTKQMRFLLGLMLATEEPSNPVEFSERQWEECLAPIETLTHAYMSLYMPTEGTIADQSEDWNRSRQVSMTAFLDYHQKGLLASGEQVTDRIRLYLCPLDAELSTLLGISASDALKIALQIGQEYQEQLDLVGEHAHKMSTHTDSVPELVKAVNQLGRTRLSDLMERYGNVGKRFWDLYMVGRGEGPPISYPTERAIVETRPFIRLSDDEAMLFNFNILLSAILLTGEEVLSGSSVSNRYFRMRDRTHEKQVTSVICRILGANAKAYENVYETPDRQHEHDLVVFTEDICLFVEAKASPPDEPFRNPERAFIRLSRNFRSETGIQGAYDQSLRLLRVVRERELPLFDEQGIEILRLPTGASDNAFCVCVTRDSFGPQATFLSFLLSKDEGEPYPWAVNILDLEQIAEAWEYFGWDERQLKTLLSQRTNLHGKVFSDDELDYVGAFIRHCGLHHFARSDYHLVQLPTTSALIFDDIYFHIHHGQPRVSINPRYPILDDLRESLRAGELVPDGNIPSGPIKTGRNDPCPCGSGVQFKKCHGQ